MIKRIELVNFMSHSHTVIEPAENGLTVLVGPNNCGKSAVMSALQILCYNENSTYVTKHGEKECSVIVETFNGDVIQWTRTRASTKYVINGETYDRLRRDVPPVLHEILNLPKVKLDQNSEDFDIHFGNQKKPVFLINESGRAAAGFFAASSDASRLLEMQKLHGQNTKDSNRDLKRLQSECEGLEQDINLLKTVPSLKEKFSDCSRLLRSMELHEKAIIELKKTTSNIRRTQRQVDELGVRSRVIGESLPPPKLLDTKNLSGLFNKIETTSRNKSSLEKLANVLEPIEPPPKVLPTAELRNTIKRIHGLTFSVGRCQSQLEQFSNLNPPPKIHETGAFGRLNDATASTKMAISNYMEKLQEIDLQIEEIDSVAEEYFLQSPICPTCNQSVDSNHFVSHLKDRNNDS